MMYEFPEPLSVSGPSMSTTIFWVEYPAVIFPSEALRFGNGVFLEANEGHVWH